MLTLSAADMSLCAGLEAALNDLERVCEVHACQQMAVLVMWMQNAMPRMRNAPEFLMKPIKLVKNNYLLHLLDVILSDYI